MYAMVNSRKGQYVNYIIIVTASEDGIQTNMCEHRRHVAVLLYLILAFMSRHWKTYPCQRYEEIKYNFSHTHLISFLKYWNKVFRLAGVWRREKRIWCALLFWASRSAYPVNVILRRIWIIKVYNILDSIHIWNY